ncbi:MAG: sugar ABC transporter permease [Anaerolineae bacterium]|jgi:multiple sugar transport system permease protein|nr:sugar ABC transporter permease [Anaerolineae bacterium]
MAFANATKRRLRPAAREEITGWLMVLPWLIGFLLFTAGPMLYSLYAGFTKYNIIADPKWIGLQNYRQLLTADPLFYKALANTFWMVAVKTPLVMMAALSIAMLLNLNLPGDRAYRTVIYLPNVLSGIAAVFLWQWILSPNGLFNTSLARIGIDGPGWFFDPRWTKPGMVVMGMWWIGGNVLIYLAGLKGIPKELYEAADLDGASGWRKMTRITLPLLTPTIFFEVVTLIIGTFQIFTTALILSGKDYALGGPGQSMLFYVLYLYNRAFGKVGQGGLQMGYASAMAWILFLIILAVTLFQLWLARRWVYYETEG